MTRFHRLLYDSAFAQGFRLSANEFIAMLFLGFVNVFEILHSIVIEFLFYLLSYFTCFFYNDVLHLRPPLILQEYR